MMEKKPSSTPETTSPIWPMGLVFLGIVLLLYPVPMGIKLLAAASIISGFVLSGGLSQRLFRSQQIPDHTVLRIARTNRGTLTPAVLALEAEIPIERAHHTLEQCTKNNLCTMDVDDKGRVVYYFLDFTDGEQPPTHLQV